MVRTPLAYLLFSLLSSFLNCRILRAAQIPPDVTLCELYQHPVQYSGQIVRVRASIAGNDLWIDDFQPKACPSWTKVILAFPDDTTPRPGFEFMRNDSFDKFAYSIRRKMSVQATFEGRFDAAFVWRDHKKILVGKEKGFGKKHQYGGRLVVRSISEVVALPKNQK